MDDVHLLFYCFFHSPSFLLSLTLYATIIWVRSKIFKYFKYLFVLQRHKEEARGGVGLWGAQGKRELNEAICHEGREEGKLQ